MWVGEYDKQTIACHMSVVFENLGTVNRALEEYVDRDKDYAIALRRFANDNGIFISY